MKTQFVLAMLLAAVSVSLTGCEYGKANEPSGEEHAHAEGEGHSEHPSHKIIVTSPVRNDVVSTQNYVCQIHSCKHIEVRALERGYLQEIRVNEGQAVKKGQLMFQILPTLYQAKLDSEIAEAKRIEIELNNAQSLGKKGIVSPQEIAIRQAELDKARANVQLARAELNFASVVAPFDGIVDRQLNQLGSLVEEGDVLTTMSDNSTMWVYFNVPEARYLEYNADLSHRDDDDDDDDDDDVKPADKPAESKEQPGAKAAAKSTPPETKQAATTHPTDAKKGPATKKVEDDDDDDDDDQESGIENTTIELKLANGEIFNHPGKIGAIEADFNNTTGNISFRADFPNPTGLLRNGQTGTILIHRILHDALVIPQRATFGILDKLYVFVVGEDGIVRQRAITVKSVQEDIFVIGDGLDEKDKIILEGVRQVRDGDKITFEYHSPEDVLKNLKYHAE